MFWIKIICVYIYSSIYITKKPTKKNNNICYHPTKLWERLLAEHNTRWKLKSNSITRSGFAQNTPLFRIDFGVCVATAERDGGDQRQRSATEIANIRYGSCDCLCTSVLCSLLLARACVLHASLLIHILPLPQSMPATHWRTCCFDSRLGSRSWFSGCVCASSSSSAGSKTRYMYVLWTRAV